MHGSLVNMAQFLLALLFVHVKLFSPGKGYSYPVDVWALGICFYFMLYQGAVGGVTETIGTKRMEMHDQSSTTEV